MNIKFENELYYWRGPSPFYFIAVPEILSKKIKKDYSALAYGWGVIPVSGLIGKTTFSTAIIPKDGLYRVPIKNIVRFGEKLELGDLVKVTLNFTIK